MCSTVNGLVNPPLRSPAEEKAQVVNSRIWRQFDNYVADVTPLWAKRALNELAAEGSRVASTYELRGEAAAMQAIDTDGWFAYISRLWHSVVPDGGQLIEPFLAAKAAAVPAFLTDAAVRWIRENGMAEAVNITRTSSAKISNQIRIGVSKGESQRQIADRIRKHYKSISRERAQTIARTEVHAAVNYGSLAMAAEQREPMRKIWLATPDDLTRDEHMEASGQKRSISQPFSVGGYPMMHPGDTSMGAGPELVVNCRCSLAYERMRRPVRPRRAA